MKKQNNYDWINTPPTEDEISTNDDGSVYIPIGIVEKKLYKLDSHWGTERFVFRLLVANGTLFADASLELIVSYGGKTRRLVGAVTVLVPPETDFSDPYANLNFSATCKSLAVANSVKPIGLAFGQGLNDRLTIITPQQKTSLNGRKKPDPVPMKADKTMQDKYNAAAESMDDKVMKVIKGVYPDIKYTGTFPIFNPRKIDTDVKS